MTDADLIQKARSLTGQWPKELIEIIDQFAAALEQRGAQLARSQATIDGMLAKHAELHTAHDRALASEQALERANEDCASWRDLAEQRATNWATAEDERDRAQTELDLVARAIPGVRYMDPPDGGSVTVGEQVARMAEHIARLESVLRGIGQYEGDAYHLGSRELCQMIAHLGATARAALEPKP